MADERNRWLDGAAAERVLRGGPAAPVGDLPAREAEAEAEARLRAALDMLAPAGTELPGEAAAVAAFRAARAESASAATAASAASAVSAAFAESVVDLGTLAPVPVTALGGARLGAAAAGHRRTRPVRFALVAALAGVAVGGIAAAAGAGLLDRVTHDTAGPAPAVSLSADEDPAPAGDTARPSSAPQLRPTPFRGTDGPSPTPGTPDAAGGDAGSAQGTGTGSDSRFGAVPGTSSASGGKGGKAGKETLGGATELHDKDKEIRLKAVDLCESYRSGHMNADRREPVSV